MSNTLTQDYLDDLPGIVFLLYLECLQTTSLCSQKLSVRGTLLHLNNIIRQKKKTQENKSAAKLGNDLILAA